MKKALLDTRDLNALKPASSFKSYFFNNCLLVFFRRGLFVIALLVITSCNFETKKISSEEVLELESKTLNWKEVDEYPAFEDCQNETELLAARVASVEVQKLLLWLLPVKLDVKPALLHRPLSQFHLF